MRQELPSALRPRRGDAVGEIRLNAHGDSTTGVVGTGTVNDGTVLVVPRVTWADVVRGTAAVLKESAVTRRETKIPGRFGKVPAVAQ